MSDRISVLLARMAVLEDELRTAVHEQKSRTFFRIDGKRVKLKRSVEAAHCRLAYLTSSRSSIAPVASKAAG